MSQAEEMPTDLPDIEPDAPEGCAKNAWCIKGAGHPGRCARNPQRARDRIRRLGAAVRNDEPGAAGRASSGSAPKAPGRPRTRRKNATSAMKPLVGMAWHGLGNLIANYGPADVGVPVGRVIQFQAPYAAEKLHPALLRLPAYAKADAATGGLFGELAPLIMAPLLVGIMASNEKARAALEPLLLGQLEQMAIVVAAERKKAADAAKQVGELDAEARAVFEAMANDLLGTMYAAPADDDLPHPAEQAGDDGAHVA